MPCRMGVRLFAEQRPTLKGIEDFESAQSGVGFVQEKLDPQLRPPAQGETPFATARRAECSKGTCMMASALAAFRSA